MAPSRPGTLLVSCILVSLLIPATSMASRAVDALQLVLDPVSHARHLPSLATGEQFQVHAVVHALSAPAVQSFQLGLEHDDSLVPIQVEAHPQVSLLLQPTLVDIYAGLESPLLVDEGPHVLATWTFVRKPGYDAAHPGHVRLRALENGEDPQFAAYAPDDHRAPFRDTGPILVGEASPTLFHFLGSSLAFVRDRGYALEWSSLGLAELALDGDPVEATGSREFVVSGPRVHTLEWVDDQGARQQQVVVDVLEEPRFQFLEAGAPPEERPELFPVRWQVDGAEVVWWEPGMVPVGTQGRRGVTAYGPTTVTLHAENEWGRTTRSITVNGDGSPRIGFFRAEPSSIDLGAQSQLSWSCSDADSVTLEPPGTTLPADGSYLVQPDSTTTYTIRAWGDGPPAVGSLEVRVQPLRIERFSVVPGESYPGETVTISWSILNASSARIEPGIGAVDPVSGSLQVVPAADSTVYTLHASRGPLEELASMRVDWMKPRAELQLFDNTARDPIELLTLVAGADSAVIQPGGHPVPLVEGFAPVLVPGTEAQTFELQAFNRAGRSTASQEYPFRPPYITSSGNGYLYEYLGNRKKVSVRIAKVLEYELRCPELFTRLIRGSYEETGVSSREIELEFWLEDEVNLLTSASNLAGTTLDTLTVVHRGEWKILASAADSLIQEGESTTIDYAVQSPGYYPRTLVLRPTGQVAVDSRRPGQFTVSPLATTQYELVFTESRSEQWRRLVTIQVVDGSTSMVAEPMNPLVGEAYALELQIPPDATSARLDPGPGEIEARSQVIQQVAYGTTDYELRVTTPRGEEVARLQVRPEDYQPVPTVVQRLDLQAVPGASSVQLEWTVETTEPAHGFVLVRKVADGTPHAMHHPAGATGSWTDPAVESGVEYRYQLQFEAAGERFESDWVAARPIGRLRARLLPNAPNPFNPSTRIWFEIGERANARLQIFDLRGQLVREVDLGEATPGRGSWLWDGGDGSGRAVSSGVYLVRLLSANSVAARKIVLAK